ncbi:hypothetical protein DXG01_007532 [Tephrocybe rancida]|nr:hypothetical protein DXG01_007532 [Tephrocybe rancida]
MASCRELADDMEATKQLQQVFAILDESSTPVALLLPWIPSTARRNEQAANAALRTMLLSYVEKRKVATTPNSDAIDFLLSQGLPSNRIMNNSEWKQKVIEEIQSIIKKYTGDSAEPRHKQLAAIPFSVWEEEMPVFDSVLRESLRLTMNGAMPRYTHRDLEILGKRVSKGSYVVYQLADVHLNPDIYTNPAVFDPTRFGPGREEDKKEPYAYLAWGAGRHPCTGMKFAKLQVKIVVAFFLSAYQYDVVDKNGMLFDRLPTPNYNDISKSQPDKEQVYFKFKRMLD